MGRELEKSVKQWLGVFIAIVSYYIIHEGTHLLLALILGVFEKILFVGIWGNTNSYYGRLFKWYKLSII